MMKKRRKISIRILIALALYLGGLISGVFIVCLTPVINANDFLVALAQDAAERYNNGEWLEDNIHPNIYFMVYDTQGNCLAQTAPPNGGINFDFTPWIEKKLQAALSKNTYCLILTEKSNEDKWYPDFVTLLGVPLVRDGSVIGAVFLARKYVDLPATVGGYIGIYTFLFGVIALWLLLVNKKEKELEQLRRDYIANISHALKSPISSIKALTETLSDGLVTDQQTQSRYYGIILSESNRLEHAVKSMLELSKMQKRTMDVSKVSVPAALIFRPVCDKFQAICDEMGISFSVSESVARLPALNTNVALVTELLEILLDNAVKFVREDGEIRLDATSAGKHVTVCVQDNGIGIEKDALPYIFERFYTGNRAYNESGNGLGLAIAMEIALALKEKLWVQSAPGEGAAFFFTIQR